MSCSHSNDCADVTSGGRLFQTWGPATGKALSPTVDRLDCGWIRRLVLAERRARRLGVVVGESATRTNGPRYDGAQPWRTLYVSTATLNWVRCGMRSQCRLISASDTWYERRKPKISRAASFKTDCAFLVKFWCEIRLRPITLLIYCIFGRHWVNRQSTPSYYVMPTISYLFHRPFVNFSVYLTFANASSCSLIWLSM